MAELILKREDLKIEYELLSMAIQSINVLSKSAGMKAGMCPVAAIQAIETISQQSMRCTPGFDEIFYPDGE